MNLKDVLTLHFSAKVRADDLVTFAIRGPFYKVAQQVFVEMAD